LISNIYHIFVIPKDYSQNFSKDERPRSKLHYRKVIIDARIAGELAVRDLRYINCE